MDELHRLLDRQLELFRDLDRRVETLLRLGVYIVAGVTIFLTFAGEHGAIRFRSTDFRDSVVLADMAIGAATHITGFWALLQAHGSLVTRDISMGSVPENMPTQPQRRDPGAIQRALIRAYRTATATNQAVYAQSAQNVNLGAAFVVLAAVTYLMAIYLVASG